MKYNVEFHIVQTGEIQVEAVSEEDAKAQVRKLSLLQLSSYLTIGARDVWVSVVKERTH